MENENYIKEKELSNNPKSIHLEELKFLIPKTETCICKIYCNDGGHGTGFFCNVPNSWHPLKVLMTNNHVLNKEEIEIGRNIKFSLNNDKINYEVKIDESRKKYTNEKYDITIIEIKQKDKLDKIDFFEIDKQIFNENPNEIFKNKNIYLLHYPKGKEMDFSLGLIKSINDYTIKHTCDSNSGSSGGPIINSLFQVIGIHKGGDIKGKNFNLGTLLKEPLEQFNKIENNKLIDIKENEDIKIEKPNNENEKKVNDELINIDEIIIQYKIENIEYSKDIRIFGDEFVKNNKDKCKIIISGNEFEITTHLNINKKQINNNIFEIKLKGIKQITNMSCMFSGKYNDFSPLSSLPDISKWNTSNITNMSYMFNYCSSLEMLPNISDWNTSNVKYMNGIFRNCTSLSSLPNISQWNTSNVMYMDSMFFGCESLSSLPDISKWNTSNVKNMNEMFKQCCLLTLLPDISKWNTSKVTDMRSMFENCSSLSYLPDISKWDTSKVKNMCNMFSGCKSLSFLPDLSKWSTLNVTDMTNIFGGCESLSSIPDISKWDTSEVTNMSNMFFGCKLLSSLPDLSKWNTLNVTDMRHMFSSEFLDYMSLSSLPDISNWNTLNVTNISYMFSGCKSLSSLPDISNWNSLNVNDMSYMFSECKSLTSLPDISKWNTSKVNCIDHMFYYCSSLSSLPDISKWNTSNASNMSSMFSYCKSLPLLPDISIWDTSNVTNMSSMFSYCSSLSSLPDISKLNISKITNMDEMFKGCRIGNQKRCIIY